MNLRLIPAGIALALAPLTISPAADAASPCKFTQGYWQNRAENAGDTTTEVWEGLREDAFYLSGIPYADVLTVSPRGNAYWILAHQLVAAEANGLSGADATDPQVSDAMARAQALMSSLTPDEVAALPGGDPLRAELVELAHILDEWNNGRLGSGKCLTDDNNN